MEAKVLLTLSVVAIMTFLTSCDVTPADTSSVDVSSQSVSSQLPSEISSEDVSSEESVSSSGTAALPDGQLEVLDMVVAEEGEAASISLLDAINRYVSAEIDGEFYIVQADEEDSDVKVALLKYNAEAENLEKVLSFRVKDQQVADLASKREEYVGKEYHTYKNRRGHIIFCPYSGQDFSLYINMTTKKAYAFKIAESEVYNLVPILLKDTETKKGYQLVEYSQDTPLSQGEIWVSHPEYGEWMGGNMYVMGRGWVLFQLWEEKIDEPGSRQSNYCLYNYESGQLTEIDQEGDIQYLSVGGRYLVYQVGNQKNVYCCEPLAGMTKELPVSGRVRDSATGEGYHISDLCLWTDGDRIYWDDYNESTKEFSVCSYDLESGKKTVHVRLPKEMNVDHAVETQQGALVKTEPRRYAGYIVGAYEGDLYFCKDNQVRKVAENVWRYYAFENYGMILVQRKTNDGFIWEKLSMP